MRNFVSSLRVSRLEAAFPRLSVQAGVLLELGRSFLEDTLGVVSNECRNAYFLAEVSFPVLLAKLLFLLRCPLLLVLLLKDHMQVRADLMEELRVL